ncbi:hypothetical protein [Thalassotalea crassostreae]|uniref:hypothetical protein n=1 Tax=Thalassotalea crassostreae TaxID=1763536 RepID=UPI000838ECE1|nr:hypothetical protein [Thalassotalea crassostreae]
MNRWKLILLSIISMTTIGCSNTPQKALQNEIGKSYNEITSARKNFTIYFNYGELLTTQSYEDGSILYIHVSKSELSKSTYLGVYERVSYKYSIYAFKVKGDIIIDWAYGLYEPESSSSFINVFALEIETSNNQPYLFIENNYRQLLKTSDGSSIDSWIDNSLSASN